MTIQEARDVLSRFDDEAVNWVRECRVQVANLIVVELDKYGEWVEVSNEQEARAIESAYDAGGGDSPLFGIDDFDSIKAALEVIEPDPNWYKCTEYHATAGFDLTWFKNMKVN